MTDFSSVALQISLDRSSAISLSLSRSFSCVLFLFFSPLILPSFLLPLFLLSLSPSLPTRARAGDEESASPPSYTCGCARKRKEGDILILPFFPSPLLPSFSLFMLICLSSLAEEIFCIARRSTLLLPLFHSLSSLPQHLRLSRVRTQGRGWGKFLLPLLHERALFLVPVSASLSRMYGREPPFFFSPAHFYALSFSTPS